MRSLGWALVGAAVAGGIGSLALGPLTGGLEQALRSLGCGFFYGLLAFHLQRVDPGDQHLQAGLVGAICGIRSLGAAIELPINFSFPLAESLPTVMMGVIRGWLPLWLPLIGSALVLRLILPLMQPIPPAPRL